MSNVQPVPETMTGVIPHLVVRGAHEALAFYEKAFGATVISKHTMPDGSIMHASIMIGKGPVFLNDEFKDMGAVSPQSLGGSPVTMMMYVPAGARSRRRDGHPGGRSVLGRSIRHAARPLRPPVGDRDSQGRSLRRGDGAPRPRSHGADAAEVAGAFETRGRGRSSGPVDCNSYKPHAGALHRPPAVRPTACHATNPALACVLRPYSEGMPRDTHAPVPPEHVKEGVCAGT